MKKGPNVNVFLGIAACAVVFGVAIDAFAFSRVTGQKAELNKVKAEIDGQVKVPGRLKESEQALAEAQAALKHLEQGVSGASYVPTMMRQLEDLGNSCGVEVTAVRPVPQPPVSTKDKPKADAAKPYDTLDIQVKGVAHYAEAAHLVSALNSFPKVVEARTVSLEPATRGNEKGQVGSPKLTVSILLRAYLFKSDDSVAMEAKEAGNGK